MAEQAGGTGGGGTNAATPPGDAAGAAAAAAAPITTQQQAALALDLLPKELRELVEGKPAAEQKMILNNLVGSVKRQNAEIIRLKEEANKRSAPADPPPTDKGKPKGTLEERILNEPEDAILEVVQKHFGSRVSRIEKEVGDAAYTSVKLEDSEFAQYEDEVKAILEENGVEATKENIYGAYQMAIGARQLQERRRSASSALNPTRTAADPPITTPKTEYNELQVEIAKAHGKTPEEYFGTERVAVKVPTGPKPAKKEGANA